MTIVNYRLTIFHYAESWSFFDFFNINVLDESLQYLPWKDETVVWKNYFYKKFLVHSQSALRNESHIPFDHLCDLQLDSYTNLFNCTSHRAPSNSTLETILSIVNGPIDPLVAPSHSLPSLLLLTSISLWFLRMNSCSRTVHFDLSAFDTSGIQFFLSLFSVFRPFHRDKSKSLKRRRAVLYRPLIGHSIQPWIVPSFLNLSQASRFPLLFSPICSLRVLLSLSPSIVLLPSIQ